MPLKKPQKKLIATVIVFLVGLGVPLFSLLFLGFLIAAVSPLPFLSSEKSIAGQVYDCADGTPLSDVSVSVKGTGWGIRGGTIVWDKSYQRSVRTDKEGNYSVRYAIETQISASKEGYLAAEDIVRDGTSLRIGMVKRTLANENEGPSVRCYLKSECNETSIINGVSTSRNRCYD